MDVPTVGSDPISEVVGGDVPINHLGDAALNFFDVRHVSCSFNHQDNRNRDADTVQ